MRALIDTGALLALSEARDQNHPRAVAIARRHRAAAGTFVGTTLILSEFYSHLLYLRGAAAARSVLERLLDDPIHEWHEVDAEMVRAAATNWLNRFADHDFSLVDAVSFELMRAVEAHRGVRFRSSLPGGWLHAARLIRGCKRVCGRRIEVLAEGFPVPYQSVMARRCQPLGDLP